MRKVRTLARPVSLFLAIFMMVIFTPYQQVMAAMISAETVLDAGRVAESRATVHAVLAREDVRQALVSQGIDVQEATSRIDSLSDAEITALADRMDQLPAGGSTVGVIVGASLIVFIVLLITDIMGYTDIFPFVKKHH
ncbi:PA2779 family protein [Desulfosarcina ovata]|uniref:PA2779 family protein n=1 Tax=Desulfosarcina ovata subsp. ovata TaxID=2752305 RepID=A0A5K8A7H9_9BACT|nr:PA2779 family protein [Desulfosarcina ovata]BBO88431.1 hypothetical protein DSCOOX_16110 [Desulfosarcina ovata subsp. ovata]